MNQVKWIGPLTWAYVIIIGGMMFTPEGGNPIVTNPAVQIIAGIAGIILGALGLMNQYQQQKGSAGPQVSGAPELLTSVAATAAVLVGTYILFTGMAQPGMRFVLGALLVATGIAGFGLRRFSGSGLTGSQG